MSTNRIAAVGFVVGFVLGQAGGMVGDPHVADALWAISSVGLVVGAVLSSLHHARRQEDLAAGGFAMLAVAECIMWSGGSMATEAGRQAFGAGTLFYVPALLALSAAPVYPTFARLGGAGSALAFAVHAGQFVLGDARPSSNPPAVVGYVLLTVPVVSWTLRAWRRDAAGASKAALGAHQSAA